MTTIAPFKFLLAAIFAITFALGIGFASTTHSAPTILDAVDFDLVADSTTDDGPAIRSMLEAAEKVSGPVVLRFPRDKVIAVKTGTERYVFRLHRQNQVAIEGNGAEFRLDPSLRFIDIFDCTEITVRNLKIDYSTQATAPGTIVGSDKGSLTLDVDLDWPAYAPLLGGPTDEDGEQDFFGKVLMHGPYGTKTVKHLYVFESENLGDGLVRIQTDSASWGRIEDGMAIDKTRVGLPVPGVAHRHGPGALCRIDYSGRIVFADVEVWTAPWFSFQIFRNHGPVTLRRVNVRPRPGSNKVLSSCRDAFHAKGNRGNLIFEDCILTGLGDDAFNISTHASRIERITSPNEITIRQRFPLQYIPMREGDILVVMNPENNEIVAERKIVSIEELPIESRQWEPAGYNSQFQGIAPRLRLKMDSPVEELEHGQIAFNRQSSNPHTVIRGCRMDRSSRLQTNFEMIDCRVDALLWIYGAELEGPGPERVVIKDSEIRARVVINGWEESNVPREYRPSEGATLLKKVVIENNEIWGNVLVEKALEVDIAGNRFPRGSDGRIIVRKSGNSD